MKNPNTNRANLNRKRPLICSLVLLLAALLWPVASVHASIYGFTLLNPNTSINPANSQTIRLDGTGVFDTSLNSVAARGTFKIIAANGTVVSRGTWKGTAFNSFVSDGGLNPGSQGGTLMIWVTLFPKGGAPVPNQLMTVICPFEQSEGVFHEDEDGTKLGSFTTITGGITVFQLLRP
jgi:hypothetical protein